MTQEPKLTPLTQATGTPEELRQVLELAQQGGGPSGEQLDRLAARVAPAVGLPLASLSGASPAVGAAPSGAAGAAGGSTSLAPPAVMGGGQAGGTVAAKSLLAKLGTSAVLKGLGLAGLVGLGAVAYGGLRSAEPDASSPANVAPSQVPPPVAAPRPSEPGSALEPRIEVTPLPVEPEAPATEPPRARRRPPRSATAAAPAKPAELELMGRAQGQRDTPAAMLRTLARHQRLYPHGMLAQERDVLRIEALVKLGRVQEARRRAAQLESAHPGSPHLARVRELLDGAP